MVATLAAGVLLRLWTALSYGGVLDADEAVVGLMGRHLAHGEITTFYWGQAYGGSHEAILAGLLFAVLGSSTVVLRLVPLILGALATWLLWRVGRRLVDPRAALAGALLFWIWPGAFVWWSVRVGNYWAVLCLSLGTILVLLRLRHQPVWSPRDMVLLGVLGGASWWANPQSVYLIAPALAWCGGALLRQVRRLPLLVLASVVGASPWLAFNLRNDWASLHFPPGPVAQNSFWDHLEGFGRVALPMAAGLRLPFSRQWILPPLGQLAYLLLLAAFVVAVVRRPRGVGLLLLTTAAFPILYAISPMTWYVDQPRYLLFLAPVGCLLLGRALRSVPPAPAAGALSLAVVLSLTTLWGMNVGYTHRNYAPDVAVPARLDGLEDLLADRGVQEAFADYWLAYRITFETGERVAVTPVYVVRHAGIDDRVRRHPSPAYIFLAGAKPLPALLDLCRSRQVPVAVTARGPWVLVQPAGRILPEELPGGWQ